LFGSRYKKFLHKVQSFGIEFESSYQNKKDLIAFNSTFFWTIALISLNVITHFFQKLYVISVVNLIAAVCFSLILYLNYKGYFKIIKHLGIVAANVYVFFMSIVGGPDLQFQFAFCIILTMIGFVFTQRKPLLIHLIGTIFFFILTKIAYYYISPLQFIPYAQRDLFTFNNGIIFTILISISAMVFRKQTNVYLKEIEEKKNVIEEKQKEIYDSINYAKRIQTAVLTKSELLDHNFGASNYFIQFQPKDIVSGDFYWAANVNPKYKIENSGFVINKFDELFYFALCDSTGHGVPGAFMSLLNMGYLSEAIKEKNIYEPNKIFDYVRQRLIESISNESQKDGFDGILICINKTSGQIAYSAANNNPVLVSGNQMLHLPTDKMPVGKGEKTAPFNLYVLNYKPNDMLYLYTDGYADQFGGPKGKKFKYKQLEELILNCANLDLQVQKQTLIERFENWKGNLEQVDDVCLIGIKI
jgi:serine phosphatase RsbU (regulator of sigma subunit)